MKWFKRKQIEIYFDLYYYIQHEQNTMKAITLDRIALSSKLHINQLKHKKVLLVKYEA